MRNNSLLGRTLANFRIERLLGRGGMAEVYYGMDVQLHRPVAIKVFDLQARTNSSQVNRFLQEARMMAQWHHANIVQIYYAGNATGLFYYVMEYVDGYDLASIMSVYADKGELMPFEDVLRIGDAIASALDYAHEHDVIHRDVKPANVLIAKNGRVVLGDFGLALNLSDKSQGEVFGSPHYISPEQARRSSDAVPQSDLYSLGVILYEMLTGVTPFNDPSPASLALQHITEPPPLPRSINPALSVEIENVLVRALDKSPKARYQTGHELMEAVRAALTARPAPVPVEAPALPPIPVGAPTVQRSDISLNSFTKRTDVVEELKKRSTTSRHHLDEIMPAPRSFKAGRVIFPALILFLLIFLGWRYFPAFNGQSATSPSPTAQDTVSAETSIPNLPIATEPVLPTVTETSIVLPTATNSATPTQLPTATLTPTETLAPSATIAAAATIKYPDGYLMTAFYNANSFYILGRGEASRSTAGFSFERVNADGSFQNHFDGWEWEKSYKVIRPRYCLSLELYPTSDPYLDPVECDNRILSNLRFAPNGSTVFWTPNDNSLEFRVLWLDEEIARCIIAAGVCDFYVP